MMSATYTVLCIPSQCVALTQSEQVKRCTPFHQCPEYLIQYLAAVFGSMEALYAKPAWIRDEDTVDEGKYTKVDEVVQ